MPNISNTELENAKCFLANLFYTAGIVTRPGKYRSVYFYKDDAVLLCNEIIHRGFTFVTKHLDEALKEVAAKGYRDGGIRIYSANGGKITRSLKQLANYIAWFCAENKIIWDDSNKTAYEMNAIKNTVLGNALYEAGCFLNTRPQVQAQPQQATPATSQKQPGQLPQNNYKSTGGQSANIINLVGQPGVKVYAQGAKVYSIIADKIGKNTPNAFVKPLDPKYQQGTENKVAFGSGNGYTDCRCFFDTMGDAQAFLQHCVNDFGGKYNNIRIETTNADKNGYFLVRTVYGQCAIKAIKMNEELEEENLAEPIKSKKDLIGDIEVYDEWFNRSIS